MYRFYGTPLQAIKSNQTGKVLFVFDTKGEYLTDDENIIRRALGFFDNIKLDAKAISALEKKTHIVPPMTITTKKEEEPVKVHNERHCKKCNFKCNNQGDLLVHYREKHPKEE
jgi:hypothetical protein